MKTRNILLEMKEPTDFQFKRLLKDALKDVLLKRKIGEKNFQFQMKSAQIEAEKRFLNRK